MPVVLLYGHQSMVSRLVCACACRLRARARRHCDLWFGLCGSCRCSCVLFVLPRRLARLSSWFCILGSILAPASRSVRAGCRLCLASSVPGVGPLSRAALSAPLGSAFALQRAFRAQSWCAFVLRMSPRLSASVCVCLSPPISVARLLLVAVGRPSVGA